MANHLTTREPAVLAALRYWRRGLAANDEGSITPDQFDEGAARLTIENVDLRCERVNLSDAPQR